MNDDEKANWLPSAPEQWKALAKMAESDVNSSVIDCWHWIIVLPVMDISPAAKSKFARAFETPDAAKERQKALHGLKANNFMAESDLIDWAKAWYNSLLETVANGDAAGEEITRSFLGEIGERFAALARSGDYKSFERMAAIIKNGGTPVSDRGGEHSEPGIMIRHFIRLHIASRGLPSKKELRVACGLTDSIEDKNAARRTMIKLGLSGLPEASARKK